jgi:Helix-turn-helix domain
MKRTSIPVETIIELRNLLSRLPVRSSARRTLIKDTAELYGVSTQTVYRTLRQHTFPHSTRRTDYGQPRVMPKQDLLRYCEVIAALKVRTSNGQGRHLSTVQAIRLLEEHGINTDNGYISAPPGLLKKARSPVALFVDDAHGLHTQTLVRLKRLVELVRNNGDRLSVILAGHPKLKNDLKRPILEEIGGRTHIFTLEGIRGHQEEYIQWILTQAAKDRVQPTDVLELETISYLGQRLSTPLQIEQYLTLAMNEAYQVVTVHSP